MFSVKCWLSLVVFTLNTPISYRLVYTAFLYYILGTSFFQMMAGSRLIQIPFFFLFFFSLALQPPWALASSFSFMIIFTDGRTPWTSDQLVIRPLPKHRINTYTKHPCLVWGSNPRSQLTSERRQFMP
jgi:hypothetical protein